MSDRNTPSKVVSLPTWKECEKAVEGGYATHLQTFIYHNEPADTGADGFQTEDEFRRQLALMIEYERQPMPTSGETPDKRSALAERLLRSAYRELNLTPGNTALCARIHEWLDPQAATCLDCELAIRDGRSSCGLHSTAVKTGAEHG